MLSRFFDAIVLLIRLWFNIWRLQLQRLDWRGLQAFTRSLAWKAGLDGWEGPRAGRGRRPWCWPGAWPARTRRRPTFRPEKNGHRQSAWANNITKELRSRQNGTTLHYSLGVGWDSGGTVGMGGRGFNPSGYSTFLNWYQPLQIEKKHSMGTGDQVYQAQQGIFFAWIGQVVQVYNLMAS